MSQSPEREIVIRITGCQPQYDGYEPEQGAEIAHAYSFEVLAGSMEEAMVLISDYPPRYRWLRDICPSSPGGFIVFQLPGGYAISVGIEFDMASGPRRAASIGDAP